MGIKQTSSSAFKINFKSPRISVIIVTVNIASILKLTIYINVKKSYQINCSVYFIINLKIHIGS